MKSNHKTLAVALSLMLAVVPAVAMADPTCVYVLGTVNSRTVATPAILVVVPDSEATIQPVRVHVDPVEQTILGYSIRLPGQDVGTDAKTVFVPGVSQTIPSIVATIPELNLDTGHCVNQSVSTPAVPVYVPASELNTPGAVVETPAIGLNILGQPVTAPGQVITVEGKTIIIPEMEAAVPGVTVGTPDESITVDLNGTIRCAEHLIPPTQL